MGIQSIERAKEIRKATENMDRKALSERAMKIIECMQKDQLYQGLWEAIGRLHIIALVMKPDGYMAEKICLGEHKEMYDLKQVAKGNFPDYKGYRKTIKTKGK